MAFATDVRHPNAGERRRARSKPARSEASRCRSCSPTDTSALGPRGKERRSIEAPTKPRLATWDFFPHPVRLLPVLFPQAALDARTKERLTTAFLEPIFATAAMDPDALATLGALRAAGFRTAIVSNTPWGSPAQSWRAELARHNLLAAVDAAVFCVDVGYRKPHRAPFDRALSLLGVRAEEAGTCRMSLSTSQVRRIGKLLKGGRLGKRGVSKWRRQRLPMAVHITP